MDGTVEDSGLTWLAYTPQEYETLLQKKVEAERARFSGMIGSMPIDVHQSPAENYRQRCRFAVRQFDGHLSYALFDRGAPNVSVETFPLGSRAARDTLGRGA